MRRLIAPLLGSLALLLFVCLAPIGSAGAAAPVKAPPLHVLKPPGAAHAVASRGATGPVMPYTLGSPPLLPGSSGNIMKAVTVYPIYWVPGHLQDGTASTIGATYKNLLKRFFVDYSGSGMAKNNTQYYGKTSPGGPTNVHISSTIHFGAAFVNTTPYPVGSCSTSQTGGNCVTQYDLATIARNTAAAHSISAGTSKMFLVYTPWGEGSCFSGGVCSDSAAAYTGYCAWHSYTGAAFGSSPNLVFSNQPWPTSPSAAPRNCLYPAGGQTFPNNRNADAQINVTSHELTEAITDPLINNWLDTSGYEIGDECAWEFGPYVGGTVGDVVWHGHPYSIQPEASNAAAGCVFDGP